MDQVLGNEHTTNPPVLISPIAENPVVENTLESSGLTPSTPSQDSVPDDEDSPDPFSTKQRVKKNKKRNDAAILMEMMMKKLEAEEEESEERTRLQKAREESLARSEQCEQQLIGGHLRTFGQAFD